jgi:flagellin-like hook-associated protein FlgL
VGDFNGDGNLDMAVSDYTGGSPGEINILLGNGDGTFDSPTTVETGTTPYTNPYSVTAGDLNDGLTDLVVTNNVAGAGASLSLLLSNGDGTFQTPTQLATGDNPLAVSVADVDGDGIQDILATSDGANNVSVFLGNSEQVTSAEILDITTQENAQSALATLEELEKRVTAESAQVGAILSRLSAALGNTRNVRGAIQEAAGRVVDVDVAEEIAKLVQAQVMQQMTTALLAQANQTQTLVLELLRN